MEIVNYEIIDYTHPEINAQTRPERFSSIAFPNYRNVYLTNAAVEELGVKPGLFIHFAVLDEHLYFYFNSDSKGFKLHSTGGTTSHASKSLRTESVRLIEYLTSRFPKHIEIGNRFKFKVTDSLINGESKLVEVLFTKPIKHRDKFVTPKPKQDVSVFSQPRESQL